VLTVLLCFVISGCVESDPLAPARISAAVNGAGRLRVYNSGVDQAVPQQPCLADARFRQFDFWLGKWRARPAANPTAPGVASRISSVLDGCVISESWGGPVRGRSINTYDPDDGQWHQTWVSGAPGGHLRLSGGLQGTDMVMAGVRTQLNGVEWHDSYRWTPQGPDQLTQSFEIVVRLGQTIFFQAQGAFLYTRDDQAMDAPEIVLTGCQPGGQSPESRQLDFWHGQWAVSAEHGPRLGSAQVSRGLSGCLTEESYSTDKGYGAISFAYFDVIERQWYRTFIDSEGERVELHGSLVGSSMVMTGSEPGPDGKTFQVRMTLSPVDANTVRQTWEVSEDDGVTWRLDQSLRYERVPASLNNEHHRSNEHMRRVLIALMAAWLTSIGCNDSTSPIDNARRPSLSVVTATAAYLLIAETGTELKPLAARVEALGGVVDDTSQCSACWRSAAQIPAFPMHCGTVPVLPTFCRTPNCRPGAQWRHLRMPAHCSRRSQ
jgi:hypothetical protein